MKLRLSVTKGHQVLSGHTSSFDFSEAGGTLGRSVRSDWVLDDPTRVISGVHAEISFADGQFRVTDRSINGVYINGSDTSLGTGNSAPLHTGDLLSIGDFEISVEVVEKDAPIEPELAPWPMPDEPGLAPPVPGDGAIPAIEGWGASQSDRVPDVLGSVGDLMGQMRQDVPAPDVRPQGDAQTPPAEVLPWDFSDIAEEWEAPAAEPPPSEPAEGAGLAPSAAPLPDKAVEAPPQQPVQSPPQPQPILPERLGEAPLGYWPGEGMQPDGEMAPHPSSEAPRQGVSAQPPQPPGEPLGYQLPEDFQPGSEVAPPPSGAAPRQGVSRQPPQPPGEPLGYRLPEDIQPGSEVAPPPPGEAQRQGVSPQPPRPPGRPPPGYPFADDMQPGSNVAPPPPSEARRQVVSPGAPHDGRVAQPTQPRRSPQEPPRAPPPLPEHRPAPTPTPSAETGLDQAMKALLAGAGLSGLDVPQGASPELFHAVGELLLLYSGGVSELLRAIGEIKDAFRISQTQVHQSENNPLRWAVTPREAIKRMLAPDENGYLAPREAVIDAVARIKAHQMGTIRGMEAALRQLLKDQAPNTLERGFEQQGRPGMLTNKTAWYWQQYAIYHHRMTESAQNNVFDLLGDAFYTAYEKQVRRIRGQRR